ncbi:MAG: peptidase C15 [Leptolyngbyaceae cyanobacterium CSU_1_4]|nr:peptidase C15 [Leptolyngbyaceae cyanobacterium CSU_1_4]
MFKTASKTVSKTVLITSFAPWKNNQLSNSSDQLLEAVLQTHNLPASVYFLRQLPVNTPVAKDMAIAQIIRLRPQVMLCCGMAELREKLSLEVRARVGNQVLQTSIHLTELMKDLSHTEISFDAGRFVCNSFYYSMMDYFRLNHSIQRSIGGSSVQHSPGFHSQCACLFIHVPILTNLNRSQILMDFCKILNKCVF